MEIEKIDIKTREKIGTFVCALLFEDGLKISYRRIEKILKLKPKFLSHNLNYKKYNSSQISNRKLTPKQEKDFVEFCKINYKISSYEECSIRWGIENDIILTYKNIRSIRKNNEEIKKIKFKIKKGAEITEELENSVVSFCKENNITKIVRLNTHNMTLINQHVWKLYYGILDESSINSILFNNLFNLKLKAKYFASSFSYGNKERNQKDLEEQFLKQFNNEIFLCPVLGIKLKLCYGHKDRDNSFSLDRIDNSKGYEKNNIWIVSQRFNKIKNNATLDELIKIGFWATNMFNKTTPPFTNS